MKTFLTAMIAMIFFSILVPVFAENTSNNADQRSEENIENTYIAVSVIRIRTGPSTEHKAVGRLDKGSTVKVYEKQDKWFRIGDSQWVYASFLEERDAAVSFRPFKVTQNINVRTGPSVESPKVGVIPKGSLINAYEQKNKWIRIRKNRWVFSKFLSEFTNTRSGPYYIVRSTINVRSGPSVKYTKVGTLLEGNLVKIHEKRNQWIKIADGKWISSDYIETIDK